MTIGSIFWFVFFACVGGIFVLIGLLMEQFSEKKWHKNINDFRGCKRRKFWGEWLVITGILVEIIVAGWSAKEELLNNPERRPLNSLQATAMLEVNVSNSITWVGSTNALPYGTNAYPYGIASCDLGRFSDWKIKPRIRLVASSYNKPIGDPNQFALDFFMPARTNSSGGHPEEISAKDAEAWDAIEIEVPYLPTNTEITGGYVAVSINGSLPNEFVIPKQKPTKPIITARKHDGTFLTFDVGQGGQISPQ